MSVHVFGAILTHFGTAANNRGLTEGNITTLQKLVWRGKVHTTVSAESIRFALRRYLGDVNGEACNRTYDEASRANLWADPEFKSWAGERPAKTHIDDDLLGFMSAEGAKQEGDKGTAKVRRAVLEITRAVSLEPWPGDVTFNAASPGATPSAQKKGSNPVPYGTEMHATRYQYGFALTPEKLSVPLRAAHAIRGLCELGEVAGNHGRFLYDFSPESVVFRVSHDPAPRILYCFEAAADGQLGIDDLLRKVGAGDVTAKELVVGGAVASQLVAKGLASAKDGQIAGNGILGESTLLAGVKGACEEVCSRLAGTRG
ncbi:MAG: type I-B CRISPR-associated protein Cas7/Cst2/DevR [Thermoanaerobaculia bacterium]|nr:type I-B CRISPR-associated protein Cas7/Cst2/DevR [Thermoanaerobaculia bacterium]